jgi:hypothetical protein
VLQWIVDSEKTKAGLEALAGSGGTSPAKASSPVFPLSDFGITITSPAAASSPVFPLSSPWRKPLLHQIHD